jgi:hypothetical protein
MLKEKLMRILLIMTAISLFSVAAVYGASKTGVTYQTAKSGSSFTPTITSPEEINKVPHPISSNKPMRKYHKDPMVRPADKMARIVMERYDPANPRHLLDKADLAEGRAAAAMEPCQSFSGITNTGWNPPDPHIAVGPSHVIVVVNSSIAIFDRNTGAQLLQSTAAYWFRNTVPAPAGGFIYDPKVIYDPQAARFVILFLCTDDVSKAEYLVSASQGPNAMGNWNSYNLDATKNGDQPTSNWADYPGLGFDYSEAIYVTSNQWQFGAGFQYSKVRIIPKSQIYSGSAVTYTDLWNMTYADGSTVFTIKPATTYSNANGEFLLSNIWYGSNYTTYWKVSDPLGTAHLTRKPQVNLAADYPSPPNMQQQGGSPVGSLGSMTQDVTYRNGKVYTTFEEGFDWGSGQVAAIRVLGIDTLSSSASVDKVFGSDQKYYFFPNIYVDPLNKIYLVYNRSASDEYIAVRYVEDLLNDNTSRVLRAGDGPHSGGDPVRWGDYAGVAGDALGQDRVWICSEYSVASQSSWSTWVGLLPSKITKPVLALPLDAAKIPSPVQLKWDQVAPASSYRLQIDDDSTFATPKLDVIVNSNTYTATSLDDRNRYYWRVIGNTTCPANEWSAKRNFTVCSYVSGDANGSGGVDISDVVFLVAYIFSGGPAPSPLLSGDATCDQAVDISDAVYLIAYIFTGGPAPCRPC